MSRKRNINHRRRGATLILSMLFVLIFSGLAVSLATMSGANVQMASNQHRAKTALYAAQSGLDCAKYIVNTVTLGQTSVNTVTTEQANQVWTALCQHVQNEALDGKSVPSASRFCDAAGSGDQLTTPALDFDGSNVDFSVRFYRYDSDPLTIRLQSTGANEATTRKVGVTMAVTKDREVLTYAMAGRGRMWLTGDTTIHGDLFSSWDRPEVSPFNMTDETTVEGTVNTVLELDDILDEGYQLETLDADDNPLDVNGDPLGENHDDRYYSEDDEIQGYHEGINYDMPNNEEMAGLDISDYNTDDYTSGLTTITSSYTTREYFPHVAGDYSTASSYSSRRLDRHVYENQTFTNALLPSNRNALFRNCTFEEVLYIDCYKSASTGYNNVRFQDCTFNGVIVTDTPQSLKWQNNALYFTGEATFNNQSSIQEATILAPHFNVDLGNTSSELSDNNVLTGAIVGGIVDIRGNAQIYGTIISMCDTTAWSSGYVTNIGATLEDGGSETTELGDIGIISITPEEDMMLPSGITSPIVIKPDQNSYSESA